MVNSLSKKESKNCWEFQNCLEETKKVFPAYQTGSGRECWFISSHYCPKNKNDYKYCWECPWLKKLNPNFDKKTELTHISQ